MKAYSPLVSLAVSGCILLLTMSVGCSSPVKQRPDDQIGRSPPPGRSHATETGTNVVDRAPGKAKNRAGSGNAGRSATAELPETAEIAQTAFTEEPAAVPLEDSFFPGGDGQSATELAQATGLRPLRTPPPAKAPSPTLSQRLEIPKELPGADAPPIVMPPIVDPDDPEQRAAREALIDQIYPDLAPMRHNLEVKSNIVQRPLSLLDLQDLAVSNNPVIVQAQSDVDRAVGNAIQAGVYPNPTVGYEADTVGSAGTRNYQGGFFTQTIKTAGKLELARAAANVDLMNAQLDLRKARIDLYTRVRTQYFAALVARQAVIANSALVSFTNEVYRVQVEQLKGSQAAAYEPMQLRALAVQARGALVQSQNRYASAWKQLAAAVGVPDLPLTELEGKPDMRTPDVDYNTALSYMLANHTEILSARNSEMQARINVRRAEVVPIPDVEVYSAIQRDFTTPGTPRTTYNLQLGVPLPIFDRNRGGIMAAQGALVRAAEEVGNMRNTLIAQLADAYERFESNRELAEYYRTQILPDQSRAYRGIYERHQQQPEDVGFGDIIVAQQNLLSAITTYISSLNNQWQAVSDLAGIMQVESLYDIETPDAIVPEPLGLPAARDDATRVPANAPKPPPVPPAAP